MSQEWKRQLHSHLSATIIRAEARPNITVLARRVGKFVNFDRDTAEFVCYHSDDHEVEIKRTPNEHEMISFLGQEHLSMLAKGTMEWADSKVFA